MSQAFFGGGGGRGGFGFEVGLRAPGFGIQ